VILPDGMNLNLELVKQGWCWWYRKYAPGHMVLEGLAHEARAEQKGLWTDPQPVPPWREWKRKERESADSIAWCCRTWSQPASLSAAPESLA
jgi:micrococcal nuclease